MTLHLNYLQTRRGRLCQFIWFILILSTFMKQLYSVRPLETRNKCLIRREPWFSSCLCFLWICERTFLFSVKRDLDPPPPPLPTGREYRNMDEVYEALLSREVDVTLIDALIAGSWEDLFNSSGLRIYQTFQHSLVYGMVLAGETKNCNSALRNSWKRIPLRNGQNCEQILRKHKRNFWATFCKAHSGKKILHSSRKPKKKYLLFLELKIMK